MGPARTRRAEWATSLALALVFLVGAVLWARPVAAQVVDTDLRTSVFLEPSKTSHMTVITPAVSVAATPWEFVTVNAGYSADVVSGASESVKAGSTFADRPDIVSALIGEDFAKWRRAAWHFTKATRISEPLTPTAPKTTIARTRSARPLARTSSRETRSSSSRSRTARTTSATWRATPFKRRRCVRSSTNPRGASTTDAT